MATQNSWNNTVIDHYISFEGGLFEVGGDITDNDIFIGKVANFGRLITIGNLIGATEVELKSGIGGISLSTAGNTDITLAPGGPNGVISTAADIVPSTDRFYSLGSTTVSWDNLYCDGLTFDDGANTLRTYTDRTAWTPALTFGGAAVGLTYSQQVGSYSRIGNVVFCVMDFTLSAKGSSVGAAEISGLPFAAFATCRHNFFVRCAVQTGATEVVGQLQASASTFQLIAEGVGGSGTAMTDADFTDTSIFRSTFFYFV